MRNSPLMITLVLVPELIICLHDYNAKDVMPHLLMYPFSSSSCIPRLNICLQNLKVETETVSIHVALPHLFLFFFSLEKQLTSIQTNTTATQMILTTVKMGEQPMNKTMAKAKN